MDRDAIRAVYDRLTPSWSNAPLKGRERRVTCPLHDDNEPSLRINDESLTWFCDPCGVGGGASDLARMVLGGREATRLLEQTCATRARAHRASSMAKGIEHSDGRSP